MRQLLTNFRFCLFSLAGFFYFCPYNKVHALGGVPALVLMLSSSNYMAANDEKGKKKKGKKPKAAVPEIVRGIVNASGVLRILSFEDFIKPVIVECGAIPVGLRALQVETRIKSAWWQRFKLKDEATAFSVSSFAFDSLRPCDRALAKMIEMKGKKWNLNMDAYNNAVAGGY